VTKSETLNDVGSSTSLAGIDDLSNWGVFIRSVVLSDVSNDEAGPETRESADPSVDVGSFFNTSEVDSVWERDVTSEPESRGSQKSRNEELDRQSSSNGF
jgi:hypothetical protein